MLLLDEPLSALDAVVRVAIREEIRRIQSSLGVTTLYVTHDQEEALAISDRVVVMNGGAVEQVGVPEIIYGEPATSFVAGFIGKMNQHVGVVDDPSRGQVRVGGHRITMPASTLAGWAPGDSATILIRPEAIAVGLPPVRCEADDNRLAGVVDAVTFLGSVRRIAVQVTGQRFVADVSPLTSGALARGTAVELTFPVSACRLLEGPGRHTTSEGR
jgi:putative spermidine/putrescine transport system ATP-binding protein